MVSPERNAWSAVWRGVAARRRGRPANPACAAGRRPPALPPLPDGVTAVEAHAVGELDTGIAVTMAGGHVRYFIASVREFHHPR